MFNKVIDLKEAWEKGIINLYPAADKGTPAFFGIYGDKNSKTNIGLYYEIEDENGEKWLATRPKDKQFFSHGFFWDKSPFASFKDLVDISKIEDDKGNLEITGWCVLIGRGSNKEYLKKDDGSLRLACIDIDGYKPKDDENNEIRKRSCDEIYKAISENAEFDFFVERSQGGGYHIWYVTKEQVLTKNVYHLDHLCFPKGSEFEGMPINDRRNNNGRNKEFIEIFSKGGSGYVSCSPTEKYTFLDDDPIEVLKMKPVEDINKELKKALEKAGFIYNLDSTTQTSTDEKPSKQDSSYVKGEYKLDELQKNILNCYREGNMNSFGYILMANFRRANYTKDEVFEIFKNLPIEQDLDKVKADLDQQYSVDYDSIAGLGGLQKVIDEYCDSKVLYSTKEFFTNFFQKQIVNTRCQPQWEELSTDEMILKENKLFILYDGEYWIRQAIKQKNPDEKCFDVLERIDEYEIETQAYLVVMQDNMGYHYGWSDDLSFNITPNVFPKFLDESESNRNQYIGQAVKYFDVYACKNAVSLFLKYLKNKFKKDTDDNYVSSVKEKLAYNAKNYDYIRYIEKANGISHDNLKRIKLMNNQYVLNNNITKEMKIIEERSIAKSEFTITGEQLRTDIYGEFEKNIIGNFAIDGLTVLKDVLGAKDIKEAKVLSKEGPKMIKYDKTDNLIKNINDTLGIRTRNDIAKNGILGVLDFITENKVNYKSDFYASVDGIFSYDDELIWFENGKVKEVKRPSESEFEKAIEVLKKLFKYTSIQDKSKIATIFKWFLSAPFAYLIRDNIINSEYIKMLNLTGTSDAGKTFLCLIFILMWIRLDERSKGTDAHNITNFAELFKTSGWPLFIDEADDILEEDKLLFIIKSIFDRNYSRSKKEQVNNNWEQKKQPAYSVCVTTSNKHVESTEKSGTKRILNMSFTDEDVSKDNGKSFEKFFNINDKHYANSDFASFEAFGREFFYQVNEKYQEQTLEEILNVFLESLGIEEVFLEYDHTEDLNKIIDDDYRRAVLEYIMDEFNEEDRFDKYNEALNRVEIFKKAVSEGRIKHVKIGKNDEYVRVYGGINKKLKKRGHKFDNMNIRTILNLFKKYNDGIDIEKTQYANVPIELLEL